MYLKKCPFCLKKEVGIYKTAYGMYYAMCVNNNCPVQPRSQQFSEKSDAADAWNNRRKTWFTR